MADEGAADGDVVLGEGGVGGDDGVGVRAGGVAVCTLGLVLVGLRIVGGQRTAVKGVGEARVPGAASSVERHGRGRVEAGGEEDHGVGRGPAELGGLAGSTRAESVHCWMDLVGVLFVVGQRWEVRYVRVERARWMVLAQKGNFGVAPGMRSLGRVVLQGREARGLLRSRGP